MIFLNVKKSLLQTLFASDATLFSFKILKEYFS